MNWQDCDARYFMSGIANIDNVPTATGWTQEIIKQAAQETGIAVFIGFPLQPNDSNLFIGLWREVGELTDIGPFYKRVEELIEESKCVKF